MSMSIRHHKLIAPSPTHSAKVNFPRVHCVNLPSGFLLDKRFGAKTQPT